MPSAGQLRRAGYVPAILYGHGIENLPLAVEERVLAKLLPDISSSTLLTLTIPSGGERPLDMLGVTPSRVEERQVLVQEVQHDPLTGHPLHVDFHQVKLTERIHARVPLRATGESPAVRDLGGVLIQSLDAIDVEAFPQDLPSEIAFDLAQLATFDDRITIANLSVPERVEVHAQPSEIVATVQPPRSEEELKELEGAVEEKVTEVKTEAEEKKATETAAAVEETPEKESKETAKRGA